MGGGGRVNLRDCVGATGPSSPNLYRAHICVLRSVISLCRDVNFEDAVSLVQKCPRGLRMPMTLRPSREMTSPANTMAED